MLEAAGKRLHHYPNVELRAGELEVPPLEKEEVDIVIFNLVLHLIDSPAHVLRTIRPALRDKGRVVIVDMVAHDREDYRRTMGHVSLGFSEHSLMSLIQEASLKLSNYQILSPDLDATGPALFVATLTL